MSCVLYSSSLTFPSRALRKLAEVFLLLKGIAKALQNFKDACTSPAEIQGVCLFVCLIAITNVLLVFGCLLEHGGFFKSILWVFI